MQSLSQNPFFTQETLSSSRTLSTKVKLWLNTTIPAPTSLWQSTGKFVATPSTSSPPQAYHRLHHDNAREVSMVCNQHHQTNHRSPLVLSFSPNSTNHSSSNHSCSNYSNTADSSTSNHHSIRPHHPATQKAESVVLFVQCQWSVSHESVLLVPL